MGFRDNEPKAHDLRPRSEVLVALTAALALTLTGCEQPLSPEQRVTRELQATASDSTSAILDLLSRPESSSRAEGGDYFNLAAANPDHFGSYPAVYAQNIQKNGKSWLRLGTEVREEPHSPHWTSVAILYEMDQPLISNTDAPLTINRLQQAVDNATLTATTVRIASGHPYSVLFRDGLGSATLTQDLIQPTIDNSVTDIETEPTYELLKTTDIVLSSATLKAIASANTYQK